MENFGTAQLILPSPASQCMRDCLRLPTILRKILQQFSNTELLKLSLVNKLWNFEARSVMRDRGNLGAKIWPYDMIWSVDRFVARHRDPCQLLVDFASDLGRMRVVPFSGITISIDHRLGCSLLSLGSLNPFYNVILDRLNWKKITVDIRDDWNRCKDCPALVLVENVFHLFGDMLEKLILCLEGREFFQNILQYRSLPRLKTFVPFPPQGRSSVDDLIKLLVPCAPNLEQISFGYMGSVYFEENVLEGSSAVLAPGFRFQPLYQKVHESLIGALRVGAIDIRTHSWNFDVELLKTYVPKVLHSSQFSLHSMETDMLFAVPLRYYGICLKNVQELVLHMNEWSLRRIGPNLLTVATSLDFTRVFPKLNQVRIQDDYESVPFSSDNLAALVEQGNASSRETPMDRAINIKKLKLDKFNYAWDSTIPIPLLAQMFPHVKTLELDTKHYNPEFPFGLLWEHFVGLEELVVNYAQVQDGYPMVGSLDDAFCGIFPSEVLELLGKDDEYLKAVNIVPVMPSIACMRNLRTFTFNFKIHSYDDNPWILDYYSTFWFSSVTGLLGFAKCPGLTVNFQVSLPHGEALGHMRPYISSYAIAAKNEDRWRWL